MGESPEWSCVTRRTSSRYGRLNPVPQPLLEIGCVAPDHMVVIAGIEVRLVNIGFTTRPDYVTTEPECQTGLKVNVLSMPGEIRNNEKALPNIRNDTVMDLVIMFNQVHPDRSESSAAECGFNSLCVYVAQVIGESHRHERAIRIDLAETKLLEAPPAVRAGARLKAILHLKKTHLRTKTYIILELSASRANPIG
jgi:hypothetical protein